MMISSVGRHASTPKRSGSSAVPSAGDFSARLLASSSRNSSLATSGRDLAIVSRSTTMWLIGTPPWLCAHLRAAASGIGNEMPQTGVGKLVSHDRGIELAVEQHLQELLAGRSALDRVGVAIFGNVRIFLNRLFATLTSAKS